MTGKGLDLELRDVPIGAVAEMLSAPRCHALQLFGSGDSQALNPVSVLALLDRCDLLILRGFNFTASSFDGLGSSLFGDLFRHHSHARRRVQGSSSTDLLPADGSHRLPHIERAYAPGIPDLVAFYCQRPASEGGHTTFQHGSEIFRRLPEPARQFFSAAKLRWTLRIRRGVWHRALGVRSKDAVEAEYARRICHYVRRDLGERVEYSFQGMELWVEFITPAVRPHLATGAPMFMNGSLAFLQDVHAGKEREGMLTLERGEPIPTAWLETALEAAESCTLPVRLQQGDVAIANNHAVLHGRTRFCDHGRRLLVQFGMRRQPT